ncbi:MAG: hypothetical protein ACHQ17_08505 [Polyangia bacterium]|jgi:hypothetical protein
MAKFRRRESKELDSGAKVMLYQDIHDGSWFVGRSGDRALDPTPLGSFCSEAAARKWADAQFGKAPWRREPPVRYRA